MKTIAILIVTLAIVTGAALAAVYTYKCPKCGLLQQYSMPGSHKCPNDGWVMFQQQ